LLGRETLNLSAKAADKSVKTGRRQETSMNHSIYSADRMTHLKIVVVALVAGILVAGFGISTRNSSDEGYTQTARVMKAGKPVVITSSNNSLVR
jgi:L-asparaginase/Glu-tRNA(Gln) amidotransferase subunit D